MQNRKYQISERKFIRTRYKTGIRSLRPSGRRLRDKKMVLTGKQKAAMLLMSLDSATAAELLEGVDAGVAKELAVELAHLDAACFSGNRQSLKLARQFCDSLQTSHDFQLKGFLKEVLKSTVGDEKTEQIQNGIQEMLHRDDPFISIRSAGSRAIASVLENEHPQTAAVVLSGLPAKKNAEVLGFLDGGIRISFINRMRNCGAISGEAKARIAEIVCRRLEAVETSGADGSVQKQSESSLRKVAVILRNLGKEIRDGLLGVIQGKDKRAGKMVADLMIVWEDITQLADRSLQKALRRIDVKKLALALVRADNKLIQKIKSNSSERMAATLSEQALLVSAYEKEDVEQAREEIVQVLREMNERGEITFIEE